MTANIQRFLDERGRQYAQVPIAGTELFALVDGADLDDLLEIAPLPWWYNDNGRGQSYVKHHQPGVRGRRGRVARKITGAGQGQIVRYLNGDRLDLRRANLTIGRGRAVGQTPLETKTNFSE